MFRILVGASAAFVALTGAFLFWQGRAENHNAMPAASYSPAGAAVIGSSLGANRFDPPAAAPKDKQAKRFARADRNKDGKITIAELLDPRKKAFAKLDRDGNGALSFEEWAGKTIDKFTTADEDKSGWLTPVEYAETAPKPPKHKICSC